MSANAENQSKSIDHKCGFVPFEIFAKKYAIGKEIGSGGFGAVYNARRITDARPTAIKFVPTRTVHNWDSTNGRDDPLEVVLLAKCQAVPGVIRMFDYTEGPNEFMIAMEHPSKGMDLYNYHDRYGLMSEMTARCVFGQIVETLQACAKVGVVHRDIKEENIVVDVGTGRVKLIDFGSGAWLAKSPYTDFLGTPAYAPPEWFMERKYDANSATVWSLGILLYNLLTGVVPYNTRIEVVSNSLHCATEWRSELSVACQSLILGCLPSKPEVRFSFEDILDHIWLSEC